MWYVECVMGEECPELREAIAAVVKFLILGLMAYVGVLLRLLTLELRDANARAREERQAFEARSQAADARAKEEREAFLERGRREREKSTARADRDRELNAR